MDLNARRDDSRESFEDEVTKIAKTLPAMTNRVVSSPRIEADATSGLMGIASAGTERFGLYNHHHIDHNGQPFDDLAREAGLARLIYQPLAYIRANRMLGGAKMMDRSPAMPSLPHTV